jgi:hypothetical protein
MKVLTKYPVYVNKKKIAGADFYMNIDGSNVRMVKAFQSWLDVKYPTWYNGGTMNKDVAKGYGTYNDATKAADAKYGKEFEDSAKALAPGMAQAAQAATTIFTGIPTQSLLTTDTSVTAKEDATKKENEDKKKRMRNILIISGVGVLVLGVFTYMMLKEKK